MTQTKENFFTNDKNFYKTFFKMLTVVALQNLIAYSVNMLDNIMLGSYSQDALSGAATVNQIFFVVNQLAIALGNGLVVLCSQYWGQKNIKDIKKVTGAALLISIILGLIIFAICAFFPMQLIRIFSSDQAIIDQGVLYLDIIKYTFFLFMISNLLISMLRSVEVVRISFAISVVSLIVNGSINYVLIFGRLGFPQMGIKGAAIGTLIARIIEFIIVLIYIGLVDKNVNLFSGSFIADSFSFSNKDALKKYIYMATPIVISSLIWAISVPMQTAILGHLSSDAIAANSVATTFFQYLKVIVIAVSSTEAVIIGKTIGQGDLSQIKQQARTLSIISVTLGLVLAIILLVLRAPLLSIYSLTPRAMELSDHFIIIMSLVMVGMSYQMPVSVGLIQGGGDNKFCLRMNIVATWCIMIPLSLITAFVIKAPVEWVVLAVQSDQIFKCLPVFLRFRSYKWIRKL